MKRPNPDVRLGGTACYTVRLRLRVTKQRTQRGGKLLISNMQTASGVRKPPVPGCACQDVAVGQERYYSFSLPDMMSK
jgi:hypothetical protein